MIKPKIQKTGRNDMFWTITIILGVLWLAALVTGRTMGGYIHVLLAAAFLMVLYRFTQGRRWA